MGIKAQAGVGLRTDARKGGLGGRRLRGGARDEAWLGQEKEGRCGIQAFVMVGDGYRRKQEAGGRWWLGEGIEGDR